MNTSQELSLFKPSIINNIKIILLSLSPLSKGNGTCFHHLQEDNLN